jgi:filamentous hemagglutinin family protein
MAVPIRSLLIFPPASVEENMNRAYRLVWNAKNGRYAVAPETARSKSSSGGLRTCSVGLLLAGTVASVTAYAATPAPTALPTGGQVVAGQAGISQSGSSMTVNQGSNQAIINWQSFDIGSQASVTFHQPSASSVALNRVLSGEASQIYGKLNANGQVYVVNPAGVIFGAGSKVDVGGLVASTLDISNEDFLAGKLRFNRNGATGGITQQGEITVKDQGVLALLAPTVKNEGILSARLGNVVLAAGDRITLDGGANGYLQVAVEPATVKTLVENKQMIVADGGQVIMTSKAADALSAGVVANSGTIQARTLAEHEGRILLLADLGHGEVKHSGLLDASAPTEGNGGFVETSAAKVSLAEGRKVTTLAAKGKTGTWLIDPNDFTIGLTSGDLTGRQLSADLASNNVTIRSADGGQAGNGDININAPVSWSADTTLTLQAQAYVNVNADITATGTNAGLVIGSITNRPIFNRGSRITLSGSNASLKMGAVGAEASYRLIHTLAELQSIADTPSGKYALAVDIDATATATWNNGAGFNPIGTASQAFTGTFSGLGHTITNLTINRPSTALAGLFGYTSNSNLHDFGLINASISAGSFGAGYALIYGIGTIAGYAEWTSINSVFSERGSVKGTDNNSLGGLIGTMRDGSLNTSYSTGTIDANEQGPALAVGGLVGSAFSGTGIYNSYSKSSLLMQKIKRDSYFGALLGYVGDFINGNYSTGNVFLSGNHASNYYNYGNCYAFSRGIVGGVDTYMGHFATANYFNSIWTLDDGVSVVGTSVSIGSAQNYSGLNFSNTWSFPAAGSQSYQATPILQRFQRDSFVFAEDISKVYDGHAVSSPTVTVAGAATSGSAAYSGSFQGAANVGSYTITPQGLSAPITDIDSYQNFGTIYYVPGTLTITKAPLTITANNVSKTYDGLTWAGLPGATYTGLVGSDTAASLNGSLSVSGAMGAVNAGAYTLTPGGLSSGNYDISFVNGTLTITKAPLTVAVDNVGKAYDGQVWSGGSATYSGFVNGENAGVLSGTLGFSGNAQGAANAGSYAITAGGLNSGNYAISYVDGTLTIAPRSITVKANDQSRYYGDANSLTGGVSVVSGSLVGSDALGNASLASAATTTSNAGQSYALTPVNATFTSGNAGNYSITYVDGTLTITPRPITLKPEDLSRTYGSANPGNAQFVLGSGSLVNGDSLKTTTVSTSATATSNAGQTFALTSGGAEFASGNAGNYLIIYQNGTLTITKAPLTITASNAGKTYDGLAWSGGNGASYSGFVNGEGAGVLSGSLSYGGNAQGASNAGTYVLTPGGLSSGNYSISFVDGNLVIGKAALTVAANNGSKTYDGQAWSGGNGASYSGFVNGEGAGALGGSLTFGGSAQGAANAGQYVLRPGGLSSGNYDIAFVDGALTITPRAITVQVNDQSRYYGYGNPNSGGVHLVGGSLVGSDALGNAVLTTGAPGNAAAGQSFSLSGSNAAFTSGNAGNYAITYVDGNLQVVKAPLTIRVNGAGRMEDGKAWNGTPGISVSGLVNGDDLSDLQGSLVFSGNGFGASKAGTYTLSASGLSSNNYAISFVDGALVISLPDAVDGVRAPTGGQLQQVSRGEDPVRRIGPNPVEGRPGWMVATHGDASPYLTLRPDHIRLPN